ncbi:MAG: 4Fe-4S dicluster domain-containing protein [Rhodospirillales bacterium]
MTSHSSSMTRRNLLTGRRAGRAIAVVEPHCLALTATSCRLCEDICLPRAVRFRPQVGGQYHPVIDAQSCTGCGDCIPVCPVGALTITTASVSDAS